MPKPLLVLNPQIASRTPKVLTTNQWTMTIDNVTYYNIVQVSGIKRAVGEQSRADGASGQVFRLTDHKIVYGDLSIVKMVDMNEPNDLRFSDLVTACHQNSTKYDGSIKKYNFQTEAAVMTVLFEGLLFREESLPQLNTENSAIFEVTYTVGVDYYEVTY